MLEYLTTWLTIPQNSVAIVLFIVALMLFKDMRYIFWKAALCAGSLTTLVWTVNYVAR